MDIDDMDLRVWATYVEAESRLGQSVEGKAHHHHHYYHHYYHHQYQYQYHDHHYYLHLHNSNNL